MKTLKYITFFIFLLILNSCQKETLDTEEQTVDTFEIELIDESYSTDLESYQNIPISFEEGTYCIREVLTDTYLFDKYVNAQAHHLQVDLTAKTEILYVSNEGLESEKEMLARVEANKATYLNKAKKQKKILAIDVKLKLWDNNNYTGFSYSKGITQWDDDYDITNYRNELLGYNIKTNRQNKANSFKYFYTIADNASISLRIYSKTNQKGSDIDLGSETAAVKNIGDSYASFGNDNAESVQFFIRYK